MDFFRHLCSFLNSIDVFRAIGKTLNDEEAFIRDPLFCAHAVKKLNSILMTSPVMADLRNTLKNETSEVRALISQSEQPREMTFYTICVPGCGELPDSWDAMIFCHALVTSKGFGPQQRKDSWDAVGDTLINLNYFCEILSHHDQFEYKQFETRLGLLHIVFRQCFFFTFEFRK